MWPPLNPPGKYQGIWVGLNWMAAGIWTTPNLWYADQSWDLILSLIHLTNCLREKHTYKAQYLALVFTQNSWKGTVQIKSHELQAKRIIYKLQLYITGYHRDNHHHLLSVNKCFNRAIKSQVEGLGLIMQQREIRPCCSAWPYSDLSNMFPTAYTKH